MNAVSVRRKVWLSIGSNIQRERMICAAIHDLGVIFGKLIVSPVYETPAEGFDGDDFYNLVIGLQTELPFASLHARLRAIEASNGRVRGAEKFSSRTLDIDVLTYGDAVGHFSGKCIPNREILEYGYVLRPLADVAPDELHPELAVSYRALWKQFPGSETDLRPIPLDCG